MGTLEGRMSKFGWIAGGWDEMSFKRAPDGWLFSLPFIWSRRTYLVTDAQRELLALPLRRTMWGVFLSVILLIVVMAQIGSVGQNYHAPEYWVAYALLGGVIMVLAWAYVTIATRPLLTQLVPTQQRITYADRFRRQATLLPTALIIVGGLFSFAFFALGVAASLTSRWDLSLIFGSAFFGILTAYWVVLFIVKRSMQHATTTPAS